MVDGSSRGITRIALVVRARGGAMVGGGNGATGTGRGLVGSIGKTEQVAGVRALVRAPRRMSSGTGIIGRGTSDGIMKRLSNGRLGITRGKTCLSTGQVPDGACLIADQSRAMFSIVPLAMAKGQRTGGVLAWALVVAPVVLAVVAFVATGL